MQIVSVIPKHLFHKAKEKQVDKRAFLAENAFQLSPNTTIDLHKMKNKDYYWLLINKDDVEIKARPKWARDLQVVDLNPDTFLIGLIMSVKITSLKNCTLNCSTEYW